MMILTRITAGPALILLLGMAVTQGCSNSGSNGKDTKADGVDTRRMINVEVETIHPGELAEYLDLTGYTEAIHDVVIASELGGTIQELAVDLGDHVREGQVLARVSADMYQAQLAETRAGLRLKKAELEKAIVLFERNSITAMQKLQAQVEFDAAEAQAALAQSRLERAVITAPFSGVIDDRFVEENELVAPGGRLLRLVDHSRMKIKSDFSELDVSTFSPGVTADVTFDALPGKVFGAELTFVAASSEPASRTFPCEFHLGEADSKVIRSGMIARIHVLKELHREVLVLPQTTIVETETGRSVFVLNSDVAQKREVTLGASNDGMVVVASGLEPGQTVVIKGHRDLVDGQPVRVTARKD